MVIMPPRKSAKMEVQPGLTDIGVSTKRDNQRAARLWAENQQPRLAAWRRHGGCLGT
jgi:hypothetical protein